MGLSGNSEERGTLIWLQYSELSKPLPHRRGSSIHWVHCFLFRSLPPLITHLWNLVWVTSSGPRMASPTILFQSYLCLPSLGIFLNQPPPPPPWLLSLMSSFKCSGLLLKPSGESLTTIEFFSSVSLDKGRVLPHNSCVTLVKSFNLSLNVLLGQMGTVMPTFFFPPVTCHSDSWSMGFYKD